MIKIRRNNERGHFNFGWLDTYHSFSFGEYYDPDHMGFRDLRVINDDKIAPGAGFGTHPHRDMEIISYVVSGALAHKDSMGNGSEIPAGDIQYMSAGSGVTHSEFNHEKNQATHLMQIWILPNQKGLPPRYKQIHVDKPEKTGALKWVVGGETDAAPIQIRQDVRMYCCILQPGQNVEHVLNPQRHAWVQVLRGEVHLNGQRLVEGDGAAISNESLLAFTGQLVETEFLLFDLN